MTAPRTLHDRLLDHARRAPDRCAVAGPAGPVSYAELAERVETRVREFAARGVDRRAVVGVGGGDDGEQLVDLLALSHLGATSFALSQQDSSRSRAEFFARVGATHTSVGGGDVTTVDPAPIEAGGPIRAASFDDDRARLLFNTSGTTGTVKIVVHTGDAIVAQAHRHVLEDERFACLASMEHNFVRRHRLYCAAVGGTNVFVDRALDPANAGVVAQLRALEATTLHLSAFQAQELLAAPDAGALAGLRLKLGGSHVPNALRERLRREVTAHLECGYGTTETGAIAFTDPADTRTDESVGRALDGIAIGIVDAQRRPVDPGAIGEVAIAGAGLFDGYLGDDARTAQRLDGGWFYTGDVGRIDADGRLLLSGRTDDVFVFNSMNVHPQELEARLREHPAVRDAVVVPQRSAVHGDVPVALVVVDDGADLRALKSFARERTGPRCPKRFVAIERVPRNAGGKILRAEARALLVGSTRS